MPQESSSAALLGSLGLTDSPERLALIDAALDGAKTAGRAEVQSERDIAYEKTTQANLAVAALSTHLTQLQALVKDLADGSVPHPHGAEPRTLVFTREFKVLLDIIGQALPEAKDGQDIFTEIQQLRGVERAHNSLISLVTSVLEDLRPVAQKRSFEDHPLATDLPSDPVTVAVDKIQHELGQSPISQALPTAVDLGRSFYPISIRRRDGSIDLSLIRAGDVMFKPNPTADGSLDNSRLSVKQPDGTWKSGLVGDSTPFVESPTNDDQNAQLKEDTRTLLMRPFGEVGVQLMRARIVPQQIGGVAALEGRKTDDESKARAQGIKFVLEVMSSPSWMLMPLRLT